MTEFWTADGAPIPLRSDVMATMQNESRLGGRLRTSEFPAAQVGSLGHAKESSKLAERSLGESLREEICYVHVRGNIADSE